MARSRIYRRIVVRCRLRCPLSPLRFQPDAQGRPRGWPAGIQLRRLPAPLPAGGACRRPAPGVKEQALDMYAEGNSLSAIGRVLGYSAQAVSQWVKRGAAGPEPTGGAQWPPHAEGTVGPSSRRWWCPAMRCGPVSGGPGHGEQSGRSCRIWTAVVREASGGCWADFEVGDRSEEPFLRLYERLPEAGLYRSDAYQVYLGWFPPERHVAGKGSAVNWNEEPAPEKAGGCIRRGGASWTG